jgi:hypothetical protein
MIKKIEKFNGNANLYGLNVEIVSHPACRRPRQTQELQNYVQFQTDSPIIQPALTPRFSPFIHLFTTTFSRQYTISALKASYFA